MSAHLAPNVKVIQAVDKPLAFQSLVPVNRRGLKIVVSTTLVVGHRYTDAGVAVNVVGQPVESAAAGSLYRVCGVRLSCSKCGGKAIGIIMNAPGGYGG